MDTELWEMWFGLSFALEIGFDRIILELNLLQATQLVNGMCNYLFMEWHIIEY